MQAGLTEYDLWCQCFGENEWRRLQSELAQQVENTEDYWLVPVHPWQKQRYLRSQYLSMYVQRQLIDLGPIWVPFYAQASIRTLSTDAPGNRYDIKTALSILNTSCYRGIPGDCIQHGARLSAWLQQKVAQDPLLQSSGLRVQKEVAGVFCAHPFQQQITQGAYRYKEMLGCIWREKAECVVDSDCKVMSFAVLLQSDTHGKSCISSLIRLSGLNAEAWLKALFSHVVVPLYHLMCCYGVGLVAHGQNLTLVLKQHIPVGCTIKDFHGDLRLYEQVLPENADLDLDIRNAVSGLPARYLLHDLLTGHFVSVLRFVSPLLYQQGVEEADFYHWLAQEIRQYQQAHPALAERFALFDVFTAQIEKVCINRVRFRIGYADSDERPQAELGTPMTNPLLSKHCA